MISVARSGENPWHIEQDHRDKSLAEKLAFPFYYKGTDEAIAVKHLVLNNNHSFFQCEGFPSCENQGQDSDLPVGFTAGRILGLNLRSSVIYKRL